MTDVTQAAFDARADLDGEPTVQASPRGAVAQGDVQLAVLDDMAAIEREWRAFEQVADGTVFQSFDWLSLWQAHIGRRNGVQPAIVTGRDGLGRLLFLLPLSIEPGFARRLTWLGSALCDYNGPLLAPAFARRFDAAGFRHLWREVLGRLQDHPRLGFDVVDLDKMPDMVGGQANPFIALGVNPNPSGAYRTALTGDWESFYAAKRSANTRRRDRSKRKKLGEIGEVRFATPVSRLDLMATLNTLMAQKSAALLAMGATDIFALPGYRDFYHALAERRDFVHVSRLDVGSQVAAANLALVSRGVYYHLLASYDGGEISKFGPGAAHMHDLMRTAIERRCATFDFTIGDERYKSEWCDGVVDLYDHVAAASPRGCVIALKAYGTGRLKRFIKQTPRLWEMASRLRAWIGSRRRG